MKLLIRKLRDRMVGLRGWLVPRIQDLLAVKKWLSQLLRRQPILRRALGLPSPRTLSVQEWMDRDHGDDERYLLDPEREVERKMPITNEPRNNWFFEANRAATIDGTSVLKLQEGFVHGHSGAQLLTRQGNYLWDANTENWLYFKNGFYMDSVLRLPAATQLNGNVAVLSHRYARNNFSHWVFDVLPRIGLLERTVGLKSIDHFLVSHTGKKYEWETLEHLGVSRKKVIQFFPHSYFQAPAIIFPSNSRYNNLSHQPSTLEFLKRSFLPADSSDRKRRLFISREDASFRRLKGEADLCRLLAPHGFEVVTLAGLPLSETAALFSSAEMIVGPFGSGLMNIAFCPPGCVIVDIAAPEFYNAHHWYLSEESGLVYACYFGNSGLIQPHHPPSWLTKDIHIDVNDCYLYIKRMIERLN
jgi:capsular polysaccharide biosynthesis protein